MTLQNAFPVNRPQIVFEPRASRRLDARFEYTRNSTATYVTRQGLINTASIGQPRFEFNYSNKTFEGLLLERQATNVLFNSETIGGTGWTKEVNINPEDSISVELNNAIAPDGKRTATKMIANNSGVGSYYQASTSTLRNNVQRSVSIFVKAGSVSSFSIRERDNEHWTAIDIANKTAEDRIAGRPPQYTRVRFIDLANGWVRVLYLGRIGSVTQTSFAINPTTNGNIYFWGAQIEDGPIHSSYIATAGSAKTREADYLSIKRVLPKSGSIFFDTRTLAAEENDTLLSLTNGRLEQIKLSYQSSDATYNSLTTVLSFKGRSKLTLPLLIPTPQRSRHLITYGKNNYQHQEVSSRYATSLRTSVPDNLTVLTIGYDGLDITKGFNGYVNTLYVWDGEVSTEVAETLMHTELDTKNADFTETYPTGALAFIINTQGDTLTGRQELKFPARDPDNNNEFTVNWGDGTESSYSGASARDVNHIYPISGIYLVWSEGRIRNLFFNNLAGSRTVLEILSWGTGEMYTQPNSMGRAFFGCVQMDFSAAARSISNLPDTSNVSVWGQAFTDCRSITGTFPRFNFSAATNFNHTWYDCRKMTGFPDVGNETRNVTQFTSTWARCEKMTSFPDINTSSGENFSSAWFRNKELVRFPELQFQSATGSPGGNDDGFFSAWKTCSKLTTFPSNRFNTTRCTEFTDAWSFCALTAASIENILVSINQANTRNGEIGLDGGTNAGKRNWTSAATAAYNSLKARGWSISTNS